jgi:uncharacterized protein YceH (UPF0502 family)
MEQVRVLACLVEKEATVPDAYPLTVNALRSACNQTSSRDPVVSFDELTIQRALDSLKTSGLVRFVHPAHGERVTRFRHVLDERLGLDRGELALLAVLALRGPQTSAELRTRTERAHAFSSPAEVEDVLRRLAEREEPLVIALPRQRWAHLLEGPVDVEALSSAAATRPASSGGGAADRIAALEAEVADLRERLARLEQELGVQLPS